MYRTRRQPKLKNEQGVVAMVIGHTLKIAVVLTTQEVGRFLPRQQEQFAVETLQVRPRAQHPQCRLH